MRVLSVTLCFVTALGHRSISPMSQADSSGTHVGGMREEEQMGTAVSDGPTSSSFEDRARLLLQKQAVDPSKLYAGNVFQSQMDEYKKFVQDPEVKVICETGFFHGVSTLFYLHTRSDVVVHTFDLKISTKALSFLRTTYGDRVTAHEGDSNKTLSTFKEKCDLISVDGGHNGETSYNDIKSFAKNAREGAILLSDDTFDRVSKDAQPCDNMDCNACDISSRGFTNYCSKNFARAVDEKVVESVKCVNYGCKKEYGAWPRGFCVGEYPSSHK